jgi:excisionase family DNA binding protein
MTGQSGSGGVTPINGGPAGEGPTTAAPAAPRDLKGVTFLTVAEVAALMRVSKMSVYRLIHAGDLEAVRFGRSFRVPESAVTTYLRDAFFETG